MITVIIPVYKEQKTIQHSLDRLQALANQELLSEILVVQTPDENYPCATLTSPKKGRAAQMNYAAKHAKADILLFLHADTELPEDAFVLIEQALKGAFSLAYKHNAFIYKLISFLTTLRSKILHLPYGDQAIFLTKAEFESVGGYEELPILEDVKLAQKIRPKVLKQKVLTDPRRYEHNGIFRTVLKHRLIMFGYALGFSAEKLNKWQSLF